MACSVVGILEGPLLGSLDGAIGVLLPVVGNLFVKGIVQVGCRQQDHNREQDTGDLEGGTPLVLEDIKADTAELIDVRMVDLGTE